ncbi:hypothetical protein NY486_15825, partial [Enterobacter hormaechei]|nr:hypothetical protein [Enterobacter hormaechei]
MSDAPAWAQSGATAPPTQQTVWQGGMAMPTPDPQQGVQPGPTVPANQPYAWQQGMVNHPQPDAPTAPHDQQPMWQGGLATPVESVPTPQPTATAAPEQQVIWQGGMPTPTPAESNAQQWQQP